MLLWISITAGIRPSLNSKKQNYNICTPFFSCNSVFLSWVIGVVLFSLGANIMWGNFSNTGSRLGNFNFSQMSPKADALNPEKQQCTSDGPFFPTENLSREYLYLIQFFVYQFYFDKIEGSCLS